jgi:DNA helicase II / ATP-dependent DNA helicase PcrA
MDFKTRYGKLNDAQKQAVDQLDGPVMVIAGPGTGKTELLSMRAANILRQTDVLPDNILCLTFTDSGATAMQQRLSQIIGPAAYKVAIHTFHSFGSEIINQNGQFFYHGAQFRPADELNSYEILREIFDELPHHSPLASKQNDEYTHLRDVLTTISELKKSGLTSDELIGILDANDKVLDANEPLFAEIFASRISKTTAEKLAQIAPRIPKDSEIALATIIPLGRILADSLATACNHANESGSTKPITAWRDSWMKKSENGEFVFKTRDRQAKLRAAATVYEQYLVRMHRAQLYDYDDMILRVVHALDVFPELRLNLQEKFQYIMVDEFQDTNLAQMRILTSLTSSDAHEGNPNILVVGDDDQAIYSFQGADIGNINSFRELFASCQLITLTDNYRSSETVLESARSVITLGSERLENYIDELDKTLTAHRPNIGSVVDLVELLSSHDERAWLAREIKSQLANGAKASEIAVLARRHSELEALLPYFAREEIAVNYERRDNVLELDIIQLIELVAQLAVALSEGQHETADSLLPKLLAHPAFAIDPLDIWRLSLRGRENHQLWLEVMAVTPKFQPLQQWLVSLSQQLVHTPLEQMIDEIVGHAQSGSPFPSSPLRDGFAPGLNSGPDVASDLGLQISRSDDEGAARQLETIYTSPLYAYYFAPEKLAEAPDSYLTYLEALRTIRTKLSEHWQDSRLTLQTFLDFLQLHRQLGSTITSVRPRTDHLTGAINLMTAHKSKGLEFNHVYITGAIDTAWGEKVRARPRLIGYPENLPLAPAGDTFDERLRLFFVAMTRARQTLTISYSLANDSGKSTLPACFLVGETWQATQSQLPQSIDSLVAQAQTAWYQPIISPLQQDMRALLASTLENYKLSSTHLTSFLDVSRGGPQYFLVNNLLKFPQAPAPHAAFGSAIHIALQRAHAHLTATGQHRPLEDILHDFEENLRLQPLSSHDLEAYTQKGSDILSKFLAAKYDTFSPSQKTELNFAGQGVRLGAARLTGSLDLVDFGENSVIVTDYKTAKAAASWTGKTDYEKTKLHKYKQQLMFYQLLIANSRDYSRYSVEKGVLQFIEPNRADEIVALEAQFSRDELERFATLVQKVWQRIVTLDLPDASDYEPSHKGILAFEEALLDE